MNLREVRKKIKSVKNVRKITKAMQLVSSVKMKKAQQLALEGRTYREALERMIRRVSGTTEMKESVFTVPAKGAKKRELIVFLTSNKGLNGSYSTSLNRYVYKHTDRERSDFIVVGKKGAMFLGFIGANIIADFSGTNPVYEVGAMFSMIEERFRRGDYDKVSVVYNKFVNTLRFDTTREQVLPVRAEDLGSETTEERKASATYTIEPLSPELINELLASFVEEKLRGAILNSEASEHSARMIAMKNATDNAGEVIYNLTLEGNKIRQSKITAELLDMITAKESVEGEKN